MVPGVLAYRMVMGLMHLSGNHTADDYSQVLYETVGIGLNVLFIVMSLAVGVAIPMLVTRKTSGKFITIGKRKKNHP
jgi:uncharacterized membrane protein YjjB (DUF3815 family)